MDLETENRIAAILLKEAAELKRQAEKDGVQVYLQKPNVRGQPNSRFLTATVLGVQQANRVIEVNEMWRVRQKEFELDRRARGRSSNENSSSSNHRDIGRSPRGTIKRDSANDINTNSCSSSKRIYGNCYSREDEGLRDEEVEEFLHARVKRGRGAVGSRMDETGPYLPGPGPCEYLSTGLDLRENHAVLGPKKPSSFMTSDESSEEELDRVECKMAKKVHSSSSDNSRKRKRKERSKDKKKKRKEKRSKY